MESSNKRKTGDDRPKPPPTAAKPDFKSSPGPGGVDGRRVFLHQTKDKKLGDRGYHMGGSPNDLAACLAGLGSFTQQLCALCEAGTHMGALWTGALAGESHSL